MAGGKVGDGYIEIHADDKPFQQEMAGVQRALRADLNKRGEALGKNLANAIGDGMSHHKAPFEKAARAALSAFRAEALKDGSKAGKAIADSIGDAMRDRLQERGKLIGKQTVQAVKRAAAAAGPVKIAVEADTAKAREDIKKLDEDLTATINADADTKAAAAKLAWVGRSRAVTLWVDANTAKARAQIASLIKGLSGWSMLMNWGTALTNLATRLPQTTLKVGLLYASLASLINPVMVLVRSIGPLASGLWQIAKGAVAIAPAMLGLVTIFGTLKGVFTKMEENNNRFVQKASSNMKTWKDNWVFVRKEIQNAFFASNRFNEAFASFGRNVVFAKTFRGGLKGVSRELSNLVSGGLEGLTTSLHPKTTKAFFDGLVNGLKAANPGIVALGRTIGIIAAKGSELFVGMGEQITRWGKQLEEWSMRTDVAEMARQSWEAWGAVWDILKGMGSTVANIFNAMTPPGSTLSQLERMAATWQRVADVTGGDKFQSAMRTIFSGAESGASALADSLGAIGDNFSDFAPTLRDVLDLLGQIGATTFTGLSDIFGDFDFRGGLEAALSGIREMVAGIDFGAVADLFGNIGLAVAAVAPMVDDFVNSFVSVANDIITAVLPVLREFSAWVQDNPGAIRELIVALIAAKVAFGLLGGAMSLSTLLGANAGQGFKSISAFLADMAGKGPAAAAAIAGVGNAAGAAGAAGKVGLLARFAPALAGIGPVAIVAGTALAAFAAIRMNNETRIAALEAERASVGDYVVALKEGATKGGKYLAAINAQIKGFGADDMGRNLGDVGKQLRYLNQIPTGGFNEWVSNLFGAKTVSQQSTEELKKLSEALAGTDFSTASGAFKQIADEAAVSQINMVTTTASWGQMTEAVTSSGVALSQVAQNPAFTEFRGKLQEIADAYGVTSLSAAEFDSWMTGKIPAAVSAAAAAMPVVTASLSQMDAGFAGVTTAAYTAATALADPSTAAKLLSDSVQTAIDTIYGLQTAQTGTAASLSTFYTGLTNAKIAAGNLGDGLNLMKPAGAANRAVLDGIAQSTKGVVAEMALHGAKQSEITKIADKGRNAFLNQYVAAVSGAKSYKTATDEVKEAARKAAEAVGLVPGQKVSNIIATTTGLPQLTALQSEINGLEGEKRTLLTVETPEAKARIEAIDAQLKALEKQKLTIKADYKVGDTSAIDDYNPDPVTGLVTVKIGENQYATFNPQDKTIKVNVVWGRVDGAMKIGASGTAKVAIRANGGIMKYFANGGFLKGFRSFASGTERHVAQIAAAGTNRLWAEPETGGESYIPLAKSKRSRSRQIWAQTGKELDMYADGGLSGAAASAYGAGGKFIGVMTMGGLMAGIKSGSGALSAALVDPMRQALAAFQNFMGIHSDSDTMIKLGGHIGSGTAKGVAEGMVKAGSHVSKAVKELIRKYVINSADFAVGKTKFEEFGGDLVTALSYGLRDGGVLLGAVLSGMASEANAAISGEIDRITKLTEEANKKLADGKKKANKAGDKALEAQIKKNKESLDKQVALLNRYKEEVDKAFAEQSKTSDLAIWWRLGEEAGAKEMAKWAQGTASTITSATLGDIDKAQDILRGMLKTATDLRTSVAESLTSGLQLKGLTNVKQLTSTLGSWAARATMFAGKLRELAKKGYPAAFIQQVAALGFADGPGVADALLAATAADVAQINTDYSTLLTQADAIGNTVVNAMYGVGADATVGFIDGLTSDLAALSKAGETLGDALVAAIAKALGIEIPGSLNNVTIPSPRIQLPGGGTIPAPGLIPIPTQPVSPMGNLTSTATLGQPMSIGALSATGGAQAAAASTVVSNDLYINGDLIGANPKVEEAVKLLLEVIGDVRRLERAGQPTGTGG